MDDINDNVNEGMNNKLDESEALPFITYDKETRSNE